jgi:hypothetical protein
MQASPNMALTGQPHSPSGSCPWDNFNLCCSSPETLFTPQRLRSIAFQRYVSSMMGSVMCANIPYQSIFMCGRGRRGPVRSAQYLSCERDVRIEPPANRETSTLCQRHTRLRAQRDGATKQVLPDGTLLPPKPRLCCSLYYFHCRLSITA